MDVLRSVELHTVVDLASAHLATGYQDKSHLWQKHCIQRPTVAALQVQKTPPTRGDDREGWRGSTEGLPPLKHTKSLEMLSAGHFGGSHYQCETKTRESRVKGRWTLGGHPFKSSWKVWVSW